MQTSAPRTTRQAAGRAAYDALYARLPEITRQRHADGWASQDEIEMAMERLALQDAGLPADDTWDDYAPIYMLSDVEYSRLIDIREEAPQGAEVRAVVVYDRTDFRRIRKARKAVDARGHVNHRRVALITWSVGPLSVRGIVPLST